MSEAPFRILSLDGGGIRGLFPAAFLTHIEEQASGKIIDHFDLLVGTSTGSIIALGLAAGLPARKILRFYQAHGPAIFSRGVRLPRWLFRPKYGNERLVAAFRDILGDKTLGDLRVPVCVPSHELVEGVPRVFKDDHHPDLHWGSTLPIWKVAAASSAAPIFFPAFQVEETDSHIDGGIWANNPVLVGITEAVRYFGQSLDNIAVLSVGTGSQAFRLSQREAKSRGILGWGNKARILNVVMDAQAKAAHNTATMLLRPEHYLRIDPDLAAPVPLDDYKAAESLIERGFQAGRTHKTKIERSFLSAPHRSSQAIAQQLPNI